MKQQFVSSIQTADALGERAVGLVEGCKRFVSYLRRHAALPKRGRARNRGMSWQPIHQNRGRHPWDGIALHAVGMGLSDTPPGVGGSNSIDRLL